MDSVDPEACTRYEKGLKTGALGMASSVVIGVASTAPAYSSAATLGLVAAAVGVYSPSIMIVAFIPMLLIASAYYYMNKADPDWRAQARRVFARIRTAATMKASDASTGCQTGAHHSLGMRNSRSRVASDEGHRRYT